MTLDTHQLVTESGQVDNTTNLLRVMLLVALAIGFLLSHSLLQLTPVHWQQSPYLLTASLPTRHEKEDDEQKVISKKKQKIDLKLNNTATN